MDRGILNEVIEAEKEVQRLVEQEQERIRLWLEQVRLETEAAVAREERKGSEERAGALDAARAEAERRARGTRETARAEAARREGLTDKDLSEAVMRHLPRILRE
jgi:vacuolar-type H+-ATPase subunit E/Vma4